MVRSARCQRGAGLWSWVSLNFHPYVVRATLFSRHPELVSGSMARAFDERSTGRESRSWMLKQVQHDEGRMRLAIYPSGNSNRSEEHTSELQSLMRISYAVFCLKKKT